MAVTVTRRAPRAALALAAALFLAPTLTAQSRLTTPKEALGWNIGDDYRLATYSQLSEYWKKLDPAPASRIAPSGPEGSCSNRSARR